jgi:hypothetical protein
VILLDPGIYDPFNFIGGEGRVGPIICPKRIVGLGRGASCLAARGRPTQPLVAGEKPFETLHLRSSETGCFGESFESGIVSYLLKLYRSEWHILCPRWLPSRGRG